MFLRVIQAAACVFGGLMFHASFAAAQAGLFLDAPTAHTAHRILTPPPTVPDQNATFGAAVVKKHPLQPVLHWAQARLPAIRQLKDYSAVLVAQERVNDVLGDQESIALTVRHKPFSVHVQFLAPRSVKGQAAVYVEGKNNGNMIARRANGRASLPVDPRGETAMKGRLNPLTEVGLANLVSRLIEVAERDVKFGECNVRYLRDAQVEDRACTCIEVTHPTPRRQFRFHIAQIFVDDELQLPICYRSYRWPKKEGGSPELLEQYTYTHLRLNNGFTDEDFSPRRLGQQGQ